MNKVEIEKIIEVTQEHIDNGKCKDCSACPIALAVSEALPGHRHINVSLSSIVVDGNLYYRLSNIEKSFIDAFDYNRSVSPFSFKLKLRKRY